MSTKTRSKAVRRRSENTRDDDSLGAGNVDAILERREKHDAFGNFNDLFRTLALSGRFVFRQSVRGVADEDVEERRFASRSIVGVVGDGRI